MKKIITLLFSIIFIETNCQIYQAKEFSKDSALYKAKTFLINEVLNTKETTQFEAIPLVAANSGELTTLLYRSTQQNLDGLILGFFWRILE